MAEWTIPKITAEQLVNQAAAALLSNIKRLTSHGGQTGGFGYAIPDVPAVALIAMLAPKIEDAKLREALQADVSDFLHRLVPPGPSSLVPPGPSKSVCVSLIQDISTLEAYNLPLTPESKAAFEIELGQCEQEKCITEGQYLQAMAVLKRLPVEKPGGIDQASHNP